APRSEPKPKFLAVTIALMSVLDAWGLCHLFSGRGAFMIFGASLGTIMVANVLFVIIPGQRELVRATREGRAVDPRPGLRGKQRSVHNTYFTLPVLFVMISGHFAMTYGARNNWLVLLAMSFAGACIRGWFVARHKPAGRRGLQAALPAVLAAVTLICLIVALAPKGRSLGAQGRGRGSGPDGQQDRGDRARTLCTLSQRQALAEIRLRCGARWDRVR
ncbi:membrane protein containing DUF989, partial [mine drainage metagenome]